MQAPGIELTICWGDDGPGWRTHRFDLPLTPGTHQVVWEEANLLGFELVVTRAMTADQMTIEVLDGPEKIMWRGFMNSMTELTYGWLPHRPWPMADRGSVDMICTGILITIPTPPPPSPDCTHKLTVGGVEHDCHQLAGHTSPHRHVDALHEYVLEWMTPSFTEDDWDDWADQEG